MSRQPFFKNGRPPPSGGLARHLSPRLGGAHALGTLLAAVLACGEPADTPVASRHAAASVEMRAKELEGRLRAPCCWNQTLDIHDSGVATTLRLEIRERLRGGESRDAIAADFASRYGEAVLAVPNGEDPRKAIPWLVLVGLGITFFMLLRLGQRWRTRSDATPPPLAASPNSAAEDERLDRELAALEP